MAVGGELKRWWDGGREAILLVASVGVMRFTVPLAAPADGALLVGLEGRCILTAGSRATALSRLVHQIGQPLLARPLLSRLRAPAGRRRRADEQEGRVRGSGNGP